MKYLIDTHTFIWFTTGDSQLSNTARLLIEDTQNDIYLSIVSIWEMAIKYSMGKLNLNKTFDKVWNDIQDNQITLLAIDFEAVATLSTLPFYHKDPFDRMIIAQAQELNIPIIGKDEIFKNYAISLIW
jgi:PIN domain nuclease of toxin-antitoxin system